MPEQKSLPAVYCELDALQTKNQKIDSCTISVVKLFCEKGGRLGLVTSKSLPEVKNCGLLDYCNLPVILCDGATIYMPQSGVEELAAVLPKKARCFVEEQMAAYPNLGIGALAIQGRWYTLRGSEALAHWRTALHLGETLRELGEVEEPLLQYHFFGPPALLRQVEQRWEEANGAQGLFWQEENLRLQAGPGGIGTALSMTQDAIGQPVWLIAKTNAVLDAAAQAAKVIAVANATLPLLEAADTWLKPEQNMGVPHFLYSLASDALNGERK